MHQFKEKSAKQRELVSAGLFFYPVLQAADVLAYKADEVPVGEDQRQHVELMREIARRFNERFGDDPGRARAPDPGGRRADHGPPGADQQDVDDRRHARQGTVLVLDDPKTVTKKIKSAVTDSGSEVKRGEGKEGIANLIEILAVVAGHARGGDRDASSRARATATSRAPSPRRSSSSWRRCASATRSCAPTRPRSRRRSRPAPRRPARSPAATLAEVRGAMGIGPGLIRRDRRRAAEAARRRLADRRAVYGGGVTSAAELDLDLDVFQGPFDLLLAVLLREEIRLAEVPLGEIVLAYVDHLERGRASSTSTR